MIQSQADENKSRKKVPKRVAVDDPVANASGSQPKRHDDLDLCRNVIEYRNNHEQRDAVEIMLHFINIK